MRVTIGLADHEDSILWSRTYRGSIDTLFDLQDAAISDVASIIERQTGGPSCSAPAPPARPTPFPRSNSTSEFWQSVENDANAVAAT